MQKPKKMYEKLNKIWRIMGGACTRTIDCLTYNNKTPLHSV